MICGAAFDLEGTVIDLEWAHWQSHLEAAEEAGLSLTLDRAIREIPCFVGGPDERTVETLSKLCDNKIDPVILLDRSRHHFQKLLTSVQEILPRPGFLNVLTPFLSRGIPVAIGSLTDRILATRLIHASGLNSYFYGERVVLKEDVAKLKPAPDVYLRTAEAMGINPEGQLVFEDSINGIRAARAAGSKVIAVPTLQSADFASKLFEAGALSVFQSWNEMNIAALVDNLNDN